MQIRILALLLGCLFGLTASRTEAAATKVELLLDKESAQPGETVLAGLRMTMAPRWHTYWRNGGDVGFPTKIVWELPVGVTAGEIQWPVPHKIFANSLTSYEYGGEAVLLIPLKLGANAPVGSQEFTAKASWLECETGGSCVPAKGTAKATLQIGTATKPSAAAPALAEAQKLLPTLKPDLAATARWEKPAAGDTRPLLIEWTTDTKHPDFFPYGGDGFEVAGPTEIVSQAGGKAVLRKQIKKSEGEWPKQLLGVLVDVSEAGHSTAFEANLLVGDAASGNATATPSGPPATRPPAQRTDSGEVTSIWHALVLAFLGGLILNIMPCVLPVIALKIFGFVNQAKEEPGRLRMLGALYSLGVITSFLLMAGVVIALKRTGESASWGMQFGNPIFLVGITSLVVLVALNLFGVFEVTLGGGAMTAASGLASKKGAIGAFLNGVFTTTLATPCTAPFLAPALGFAFVQPPASILLLFATIGAGLALPYFLLCMRPGWLQLLPKPGQWMVHFKVAMGFPMLATACWLLWVSTKMFGRDGTLWLGLFFVVLALSAWIWGEFVQRGSERREVAMIVSILLLIGAYAFALERQLHWRNPTPQDQINGIIKSSPDGIEWYPWSHEAIAKARADGHVVFVDFTADYCQTCKINKASSIEIDATRQKLKAINAVALIADNTLFPPAITAELKKFGRAGVPMVLVYPRDPKAEAILLPTLLTPNIVLEALDQAAK